MMVEVEPVTMSDTTTQHHAFKVFFLIDLLLLCLFKNQMNQHISLIHTLQLNFISYIFRVLTAL